ncbi:c-type cytochrome [Roseospira marina]|uniref:C-type cytochrome n=1 Tax=Roseospira marina TaxID=140057 RepID=A0A5M6IEQ5_9PROT|nr:c-type cytochrome [Roseospira marina]KAA5606028.1 c-type cytochrome [Roseospira marina]MBB4313111.1 mono/diheme cytochrome c family protein [Roseospira marina]MBB5086148.1 mono/diheme cytochrome c family protein [Roseospira marina]
MTQTQITSFAHRHVALLAAAIVVLALTAPAQAQDATEGARLYRDTCADCHGRQGEDKALGQSRPLRTLDAETVRETLIARRADPRSMQDRIKAGLTDREVEALAAYVAAFPSP